MKTRIYSKTILAVCALLFQLSAYAVQPGHNNCSDPMELTVYMEDIPETIDGTGSSASGLNAGSCADENRTDNFFVFTATSQTVETKLTYNASHNYRYELYSTNDQCNSSNYMTCGLVRDGSTVNLSGLQIGNEYVIRVSHPSSGQSLGMYNIQLKDPINGSSILSVGFKTFDVQAQDNGTNLLHWVTASEHNNEGFRIQRSSNGIDWQDLYFAAGKGTTEYESDYTWIDQKPQPLTYYRLISVDLDGSEEIHPIVQVSNLHYAVQVFPTIVKSGESFTIKSPQQEEVIYIFSTSGQLVSTYFKQNYIEEIPSNELPSGMYLIHIGKGNTIPPERVFIH